MSDKSLGRSAFYKDIFTKGKKMEDKSRLGSAVYENLFFSSWKKRKMDSNEVFGKSITTQTYQNSKKF